MRKIGSNKYVFHFNKVKLNNATNNYINKRNNSKNAKPSTIETGSVNTQAMAMLFKVALFRLLAPPDATIEPAIPLDNTCVVLTGNPSEVLIPMVDAAMISEVAPCA
jgi:hypothetical protein